MTKKICEYVVTGDGPFPLDMLRYDRSWPSDQHSVQQMAPGVICKRDVRLETNERGPDSNRWESMGWSVYTSRRY